MDKRGGAQRWMVDLSAIWNISTYMGGLGCLLSWLEWNNGAQGIMSAGRILGPSIYTIMKILMRKWLNITRVYGMLMCTIATLFDIDIAFMLMRYALLAIISASIWASCSREAFSSNASTWWLISSYC